MKKLLYFSILTTLLILASFTIIQAKNSKIEAKILNKLDNQEKVRVIVNLKQDSNKAIQSQTVNSIIPKSKQKHNFENSFTAELTREELERLEASSIVKSIKEVGYKQILLSTSVNLVNASLTWSLQISGINLTGQGESICIIDTGINYSHSNLGNCYGNSVLTSECKIWGGYDYCADNVACNTADSIPEDRNGHGTHVSGIAAANGSINGVAKGARIIMLKACNSSGTCFDDDIKASIDWCVSNSSIFNISVISLSLGGGLYTDYCDGVDDSADITGAINSAVGKNISVVVATGNANNYTAISSPACIRNATAIGATNKSDAVASYSNRNSLVSLFATGDSITSTYPGGSASMSGTSMATPHVAGAIAIIKQFLKLSNQIKTLKQLETILNSTGKRISDSLSGLNFSRINIYSAVLSIDNIAPNITLKSPVNQHINSTSNQTFSCNSSDWQLSNLTFYLWNSSSLINQTTSSISGTFNQSSFNIYNLAPAAYSWNCLSTDSIGNSAFSSQNFTISINTISTILNSPANLNYTNSNQTNFTCLSQAATYSLSNVTFYLWNSTSLVYSELKNISALENTTTFNVTFAYEASYLWNCLSFNNNSESAFAYLNYTITLDKTAPVINLISPADATSSTTNAYNFTFNVSDMNISLCKLIFDNSSINQLTAISLTTANGMYNSSLTVASHTWSINCTDKAGNTGNSSTRTLTVSQETVQSTGGSGSTSPSTAPTSSTYEISSEQSSNGYEQSLRKNDKIKFSTSDSAKHTVTLSAIGKDSANLTIQSSLIKLTLTVLQEIKLNLSSQDYYSLYVKLESITNNSAKIKIQAINESMHPETIVPKEIQTTPKNESISENTPELPSSSSYSMLSKKSLFNVISIVLIAVAAIIAIKLKIIKISHHQSDG